MSCLSRIAVGASIALLLAAGAAAQDAAPAEPATLTVWERPELLRTGSGAREQLEEHGVGVKLWLTQYYQGVIDGDPEADRDWQYGGRGDVWVTTDLSKLGLWEGFGISIHGSAVFEDDVNFAGDGSVMPLNSGLAFPRLAGDDADITSLHFTQKFSNGVSIMAGKIDMLDVASKTPLVGGGGLVGFQNMAFAAPPSGLVPGVMFGALASIPTKHVRFTLAVYDPAEAMARNPLDDAFEKGVTGMVGATVPLEIGGMPGFYGLSFKANNKVGLDLDDLAGVLLPPESEDILGSSKGGWNVSFSFQQYLHRSASNPKEGWGVFGVVGRSDGNPTPFEWLAELGLAGSALIPGRDSDSFGVGFFFLSISGDLIDGLDVIADALGDSSLLLEDEMGLEIFYEAAITGWLRVGFDIQWIDPHQRAKDSAMIGGLRARVLF